MAKFFSEYIIKKLFELLTWISLCWKSCTVIGRKAQAMIRIMRYCHIPDLRKFKRLKFLKVYVDVWNLVNRMFTRVVP
jgi:hypothetical protein